MKRSGQLLEDLQKRKKRQIWLAAAGIVLITMWSARETDFSVVSVVRGFGEIVRFIGQDFFPPDFSAFRSLIGPAVNTICISFVAMVVGAVLSLLLSFFAAATTCPYRWLQASVRAVCSVLRNIPALIWALLLVAAYGLGTLVGTLALILTSVGTLTRAYAEILEEIDMGQVEAVRATGASWPQVIAHAVLPQFFPGFVGWSLYKLELNMRASTLIGMVGGGGLGFSIQKGLKLFQFQEVCVAILMVIVLVLTTEFITGKLRERLI